MRISAVADKKIGAFEARRQFGQILKGVEVKGDRFVVERHGEPVAAVIPIEIYDQWKRGRREFFAQIRSAAEASDLTEDKAEVVISRALKAVRSAAKV